MKKLPQFLLFIIIIFIPSLKLLIDIYQNQLWLDLVRWLPLLLWLLGSMLGYLMLQLDQIVDIFVINPDSNLAKAVKNYINKKHFTYSLNLLETNKPLQNRLSFRSATFQLIWVLLAFFTFSSTSSVFGKGFVMGLGARLLLEQWGYFLTNRYLLKNWLFWQLKREINDQQLKWYLIIISIIILLLDITVRI